MDRSFIVKQVADSLNYICPCCSEFTNFVIYVSLTSLLVFEL